MLKSKLSLPNKGFLPVVIILALSLVSVLSVAVFLAFKEGDSPVADNSVATEQSTKAFQAANSGSETILKKIYKEDKAADLKALAEATNSECSEGVISGSTPVGSYKVSLFDHSGEQIKNCSDSAWRGQVAKLKSEGVSGDTSRGIDVAVAAEPTPGITGGCEVTRNDHGATEQGMNADGVTSLAVLKSRVSSTWGKGCQAATTDFPNHKSIYCTDGVAAPGYSCGKADSTTQGGIGLYMETCICVKN